jgi:hypothetical protein
MATLAKKRDGAYGPIPDQRLRQGWTMPVGDTVFPESLEALTPFMTPQPDDTPAQVQIKVGLKTAVAFLDQCQGNVSEAMTSFFQDVRAFFRAMMPSEASWWDFSRGCFFAPVRGWRGGGLCWNNACTRP